MKKIVYVDMDGVLVDFNSGIDSLTFQEALEYEGRYDKMLASFQGCFLCSKRTRCFQKVIGEI